MKKLFALALVLVLPLSAQAQTKKDAENALANLENGIDFADIELTVTTGELGARSATYGDLMTRLQAVKSKMKAGDFDAAQSSLATGGDNVSAAQSHHMAETNWVSSAKSNQKSAETEFGLGNWKNCVDASDKGLVDCGLATVSASACIDSLLEADDWFYLAEALIKQYE